MKYSILIICIVWAGVWSGCAGNGQAPAIQAGKAVTIDTATASCSYLTTDNKGNIVLSWVRKINDSVAAFCYAVSTDKGHSFGVPVVIPHTQHVKPHGENIPKILFKPSGEVIAMWGEANSNPLNKYSGLVFYTQSFDDGKSWTAVQPLVKDTASYDQRYFDMALLKNGEAAVLWLDNRKQAASEGSTLYFAATNGKNGFTPERAIGESCCQCCRTDLLVDEAGAIHVLYRDIISDSIRDMVHAVSTDGKTFSNAQPISKDNWVIRGCPHSGPAMVVNKKGLHFAWFTGGTAKGIFYCRSADNGTTFSVRDSVRQRATAKHPQMAAWADDMLIAWDESMPKENKVASLIGISQRDDHGSKGQPIFISDAAKRSSFPAIQVIDNKTALVAYTQTDEQERDHVVYQVLSINP